MRVMHVSGSDVGGGAARAAYGIHKSVQESGIDSQMLVQNRLTRDASVVRYRPSPQFIQRSKRILRRWWLDKAQPAQSNPDQHGRFSDGRSWLGGELAAHFGSCDLVHLHWVSDFVDFEGFLPAAARRVPLVWTLHDMNPFTGGCHYDGACGRFEDRCGVCPMLKNPGEIDASRRAWQRKLEIFGRIPADRMKIVTPSKWLSGQAARSSLFKKYEIATIPYGLDTQLFAPRDRGFAREVLGIPSVARVVLFVAQSIRDERKGVRFLMEAVNSMDDVFLLSLGSGDPLAGKNALHLDLIKDDRLLSLIYSAADAFVAPSVEDNMPQTVLEAMACGVPVVGTRVGGIPDAVRHGETGFLVPPGDSGALRKALDRVLGDAQLRAQFAAQARATAVAEYGLLQQGQAYGEIYRQLPLTTLPT